MAAIFKMAVTTAARSRVFISYMILTIKKLLIHQISCFYDNLNNLATNRSTNSENPAQCNTRMHRGKQGAIC